MTDQIETGGCIQLGIFEELTVQPGPPDIDQHRGEGDAHIALGHVAIHVFLVLLVRIRASQTPKAKGDTARHVHAPRTRN